MFSRPWRVRASTTRRLMVDEPAHAYPNWNLHCGHEIGEMNLVLRLGVYNDARELTSRFVLVHRSRTCHLDTSALIFVLSLHDLTVSSF